MGGEFQAAERERTGEEITFELGGRTFHVRRRLPFGLVGQMANKARDDQGIELFDAFVQLLCGAVKASERDALREVVLGVPDDDDEEAIVTFEDVSEVSRLIIERVTGSPFGQSSDSRPSRLPNGVMSPAIVSTAGTTSAPSRRVKLS